MLEKARAVMPAKPAAPAKAAPSKAAQSAAPAKPASGMSCSFLKMDDSAFCLLDHNL